MHTTRRLWSALASWLIYTHHPWSDSVLLHNRIFFSHFVENVQREIRCERTLFSTKRVAMKLMSHLIGAHASVLGINLCEFAQSVGGHGQSSQTGWRRQRRRWKVKLPGLCGSPRHYVSALTGWCSILPVYETNHKIWIYFWTAKKEGGNLLNRRMETTFS